MAHHDRSHPVLLAMLIALAALLVLTTAASAQQPGRVLGRVVDGATDEGVAGAQVLIPALDRGTIADEAGRFTLTDVPAGTHELRIVMIGYGDATAAVDVRPGAAAMVTILIDAQAIEIEGLTVTGERRAGSSVALQAERQQATVVVDAVGADQISRSSDGDAAAVAARSPGVTVVGGRYVYVRGLGGRYGSATLNGAPLASAEPDRKAVPLDLIPSSMLESVVTAKTFAPDQPGDYAGGLVQVRTKSYPSASLFKVGGSLGYDSEASFAHGLAAPGNLNVLGFAGGSRDLPAAVSPDVKLSSANYSPDQLQSIGRAFDDRFGASSREIPLSGSFNAVGGNRWLLGPEERPLGFLVSLSYSNGWDNRLGEIERVHSLQSIEGSDPAEVDYAGSRTIHEVATGGLAQATFEPSDDHELSTSVVYNRVAEDEARVLEGPNFDAQGVLRTHRLRYIARDMVTAQLRGVHSPDALGGLRVEWRGDLRYAAQDEPDTRDLLYQRVGEQYLWQNFVQSGSVLHQQLDERGWGGTLELILPVSLLERPASLRAGGAADVRDREVDTRRFRYLQRGTLSEEVRTLGPNEIFADENIRPTDGFEITEATFPGDNYTADQSVLAGFAMLDFEPIEHLRVVAGARVEKAEQRVDAVDRFDDFGTTLEPARLNDTDVLPALNVTWLLSPSMNVRLGASRTVARPQFRELAPFQYADYAGGIATIGNPRLDRSTIGNLDVRWEWFPTLDATVAVSGFYKAFDRPIETVLFGNEALQSWINALDATVYGTELEVRTDLGFVAPALADVAVNANLTLVESSVTAPDTALIVLGRTEQSITFPARERALQGQSPYVINLGVGWVMPSGGTSLNVLYNRSGERITSIGAQGLPNVFEAPRDILDLIAQQPLGGAWSLKLAAENVLDSAVEFTQGGSLLRRYSPGRSVSLGVSWGGAD